MKFFAALLALPATARLISPMETQEYASLVESAPTEEPLTDSKTALVHPEGVCDTVPQTSGYVAFTNAKGKQKRFFIWQFDARKDAENAPLMFWYTGGPGCSSQLALLSENGPCKVKKDKSSETELNPHSWNEVANMVWIDQPAGSGFSEGAYPTNEDEVAADMKAFFVEFYKQFPKFQGRDLYISGESYAGHYLPAIGNMLVNELTDVKLKGVLIGNGLVNPSVQYLEYPDYAHDGGKKYGGSLAGHGVTNAVAYGVMKAGAGPCGKIAAGCTGADTQGACRAAFYACNYAEEVPYRLTGRNPYDMSQMCEHGNLCYDFTKETDFLNDKTVQGKIGAGSKTWASCNMAVNLAMQGDFMRNMDKEVVNILKHDVPVLVYNGDKDFICNFAGGYEWTNQLEWDGATAFQKAEYEELFSKAARARGANGLTFMQVREAGHMVPMDQPEVALEMIKAFLAKSLPGMQKTEEVVV